MSNFRGIDQVIEVGATPALVGQVQSATGSMAHEVLEGRGAGDENSDPIAGNFSGTFTVTARFDRADAGQALLVLKGYQDIVWKLGPDVSGTPTLSFNALISETEYEAPIEGLIEATFTMNTKGAVTEGTIV